MLYKRHFLFTMEDLRCAHSARASESLLVLHGVLKNDRTFHAGIYRDRSVREKWPRLRQFITTRKTRERNIPQILNEFTPFCTNVVAIIAVYMFQTYHKALHPILVSVLEYQSLGIPRNKSYGYTK